MKVIYVFDALCNWCYGFSPVIEELYTEYHRRLPFEVVCGGLMRGDKRGPLSEVGDYIKESHEDISRKTGVVFGEEFLDYLEEGSTVFDSVPPARAIAAFKTLAPNKSLLFAGAIQRAIYEDGINPNNFLPYVDIADDFDVDPREFKSLLQDAQSEEWAEADFRRTIELGATGYPTVYFEFDGEHHLLARGYTDFNVLQARFDHVVNRAGKKERSQ